MEYMNYQFQKSTSSIKDMGVESMNDGWLMIIVGIMMMWMW